MPENIIPDAEQLSAQMVAEYVDILANFRCRMTPREADAYLGIKHDSILGACKRKEIEHSMAGSGYRVTPKALAIYVRDHLTIKADPLPG